MGVKEDTAALNAPVPEPEDWSVTPLSPMVGVLSVVLYTNPLAVTLPPPLEVISPFKVAEVAVTEVAAKVESTGGVAPDWVVALAVGADAVR